MGRHQQGLPRNISLPYLVRTRLNPTIIQIKRQERNYYRQLKVWKMRLTSCIPALGMLTSPLVSLSKPVGPIIQRTNMAFLFIKKGRAIGCTRYLPLSLTRAAKLTFIHQTRKKFVPPLQYPYFRSTIIPE